LPFAVAFFKKPALTSVLGQMYPRAQLMALRLEDFNHDPKAHLSGVFDFLGLPEPTDENW